MPEALTQSSRQHDKRGFLTQSGWLAFATGTSGVFMMLVHSVAQLMPPSEYAVFVTLLRVLTLLSFASVGLQPVVAQQTAASTSTGRFGELTGALRFIIGLIVRAWIMLMVLVALFQNELVRLLKLSDPKSLWLTALLVLGALLHPVAQGVLQGIQNFRWLGLAIISNGVLRLGLSAVFVLVVHSSATGVVGSAVVAIVVSLSIAIWQIWEFLRGAADAFDWRAWARIVWPAALLSASSTVLISMDYIMIRAMMPQEATMYYAPAATLAVALVVLTTPIATVMLPKIARSMALGQKSNSLQTALVSTLVVGAAGALVCTIAPSIPLGIMFPGNKLFQISGKILPWVIWAIAPMTLANVLIGDMIAKTRFEATKWLVTIGVVYVGTLYAYLRPLHGRGAISLDEAFRIFRTVAQIFSIHTILFLAVAFYFTRKTRPPVRIFAA
jgi:O-antigen/teichoic acid export membrane protein